MHFLIGLVIFSGIIYFAFVRNPDDTTEQALKKIARLVIFTVVILGILLVLAINGAFD